MSRITIKDLTVRDLKQVRTACKKLLRYYESDEINSIYCPLCKMGTKIRDRKRFIGEICIACPHNLIHNREDGCVDVMNTLDKCKNVDYWRESKPQAWLDIRIPELKSDIELLSKEIESRKRK